MARHEKLPQQRMRKREALTHEGDALDGLPLEEAVFLGLERGQRVDLLEEAHEVVDKLGGREGGGRRGERERKEELSAEKAANDYSLSPAPAAALKGSRGVAAIY